MKTLLAAIAMTLTIVTPGAGQVVSTNTLRVPLESKVVKDAPYSAEIEIDTIQTLADGNRIVRGSTGRVYRDSAGRIRREEDRPSGQPSISIVDPVAGVSYSLDPERRVAWKTTAPATMEILHKIEMLTRDVAKAHEASHGAMAPNARPHDAGHGPVAANARLSEQREEGLPARTIEGIRAQGIRRTSVIPAGEIGNEQPMTVVSEEWTSPELQVLVLTRHNDPRMGESSYRMRNINRTEPYASLFQVPSDYTIRETGIRKFEHQD